MAHSAIALANTDSLEKSEVALLGEARQCSSRVPMDWQQMRKIQTENGCLYLQSIVCKCNAQIQGC